MRLITVVMGAASTDARAVETQKLLTFGFRSFENHQLFTDNHVLGNAKVWSGVADAVDVGIQNAMSVTLPRGQLDSLETVLELDENIKAPITAGQQLGKVRVSLGEEVFYDGPVVAMQDVAQGGWIKRLMDWLHLFFLSFFS
jgi:D-alanyl-D-alanine carboxypeptidase (penicillin-binding protein 5/6)